MNIIEKKKGAKKYYYLRYNLKREGKVVTKDKYLGTEIPKNIDKIQEEFKKEIQKDANKKLEAIKNNFQSEWARLPKSIKKKELEEISIAFTYNTNAIEGSTITLEEAREII